MELTTISRYQPQPGEIWEWPITTTGTPTRSPIAPSFNQQFHLAGATADPDGRSVWLAAAFTVTHALDRAALATALTAFLQRHPTLRSEFRAQDGTVTRHIHASTTITGPQRLPHDATTPRQMQQLLARLLGEHCRPTRYPAMRFLAIDHGSTATIIAAFDHVHADAYSIALAIHELSRDYLAAHHGTPLAPGDAGDFVADTAHETAMPPTPREDWRIQRWLHYLRSSGGTAPSFPLPLGIGEPGTLHPQADDSRQLLDAHQAHHFEKWVRTHGGSMFSGLATSLGMATKACGGPLRQDILMPVHTRHRPLSDRTFGWYTNTVALTINVPSASFATNLAANHAAFRSALELAPVPLAHVLTALADEFQRTRQDVYMLSYIDYRALPGIAPGHDGATCTDPVHISNSTVADDAQFWLWRDERGIFLRSRYPRTDASGHVMNALWSEWREALRAPATPQPARE
ncbi:condensation domain-containing protein [Lolliginicoccus suaedae]|uniref:condensation domain-containing protein n=1 Tax=Lolliginicoccus suaedae TaxID=2605429 RepID=UPI0011ED98BC|nr:condensation domain-containing protein [Lolliginicoccus suaedae]